MLASSAICFGFSGQIYNRLTRYKSFFHFLFYLVYYFACCNFLVKFVFVFVYLVHFSSHVIKIFIVFSFLVLRQPYLLVSKTAAVFSVRIQCGYRLYKISEIYSNKFYSQPAHKSLNSISKNGIYSVQD